MHLLHRWWSHPADYTWTAEYHRSHPLLRHVRLAVGTWCWMYAVLGVLVTFTPAGAPAGAAQVLALSLAGGAVVIGGWWVRGPWPGENLSRLFVVYLEVSAAAALSMLADPFVALPSASAFAVVGSYIAALHSPKMIVGHQLWATAIVGVLFVRAVAEHDADVVLACVYLLLLTLVLFSSPMLTYVLLLLLRGDAAAAFFDPLTGLRNRRGLSTAVTERGVRGGVATVMVIDVDNFKAVNDRYGHAHGDVVLQRTATAIYAYFAPPEVTARTGGEEFVAVIYTEPDDALARAAAVRDWFAEHLDEVGVTVSIGVAQCDASRLREEFEVICGRADAAMYTAKRSGGNTVRIYNTETEPVVD